MPLGTTAEMLGVIGVKLSGKAAPNLEQNNLLEAFARQAALVIDRLRLHEAAQQSHLAAESERLVKSLLDSISHEMRTPIAAISGAAAALGEIDALASNEHSQAMLDEIKEAAARLNRLVGNILDMTRVESGQMKPKMDWCDVGDLVHLTVKHLQKDLRGHPVNIALFSQLPLVRMDFVLMEQALTNLLLNAAFHTPPGTPIQIGATVHNQELALTVSDKGPGIPAAAMDRIFDKFYRAPGAAAGGTGLGLSIVKGFLEAQNGRVQAVNQPEGGAAFSLFLPLGEVPAVLLETA
jgi:two-component system sensor histidine kinase KdpD